MTSAPSRKWTVWICAGDARADIDVLDRFEAAGELVPQGHRLLLDDGDGDRRRRRRDRQAAASDWELALGMRHDAAATAATTTIAPAPKTGASFLREHRDCSVRNYLTDATYVWGRPGVKG